MEKLLYLYPFIMGPLGDTILSFTKSMVFDMDAHFMPLVGAFKSGVVGLRNRLDMYYATLIIYDNSIFYKKFITYLIHAHNAELLSNDIDFIHSDVDLSDVKFKNAVLTETYEVDGKTHTIYVVFDVACKDCIVKVQSKTLSIKELQKYIEHSVTRILDMKLIKVFQPSFSYENGKGEAIDLENIKGRGKGRSRNGKKISSHIQWNENMVSTNKSLVNTILSDHVRAEFIADVQCFLRSEEYYNTKGIPYKRGYCLYGPPGTGKTSAIKALASTYGMDIYIINTENLINPEDITTVFRGFSNASNFHIVCFEDIDRCELLKPQSVIRNQRYVNEDNKGLRTFLNELDGIVEGNKRLTIFTANDKSTIDSIEALCRPGRIDKMIEIGYCDAKQLNEIFNHYTDSGTTLAVETLKHDKITPAVAIKTILQNTRMTNEEYLKELGESVLAGADTDAAGDEDDDAVSNDSAKDERFARNHRQCINYALSLKTKLPKLFDDIKNQQKRLHEFIDNADNTTENLVFKRRRLQEMKTINTQMTTIQHGLFKLTDKYHNGMG